MSIGSYTDESGFGGLEEFAFDSIGENLCKGMWESQDYTQYKISEMTTSHLRNTIRHLQRKSSSMSFSCDSELFDDVIDVMQDELISRNGKLVVKKPKAANHKQKQATRGSKVKLKCHCGDVYEARSADIKRGWAKSCSKRCAAIKRDFGRPNPVLADTGEKVKFGKKK